jgi:O-antigen/teichoic acid export membrane protein
VSIGFIAYVTVAAVLTVPLFVASPHLASLFVSPGVTTGEVADVLRLVSLGLLPLLLMSGGLAVAVGLQRFEVPMLAAVAQNGLTVVAAVVVVSLGGSVAQVVLSSLCVLSLTAIASVAFGIRSLRQMGATALFRRDYVRPTLSYVLFTGTSSLGTLLFSSVDRLAVGAVLGLRAVAYYTVSIGIATKLLSLADVLTRPLMPFASARFGTGEFESVRERFRRVTASVAAGSLTCGVLMLLLSGPALRLWLGPAFAHHALPTFRVLVVVYALIAVSAPGYHIANGIGAAWICAAAVLAGGAATIGLIFVLGPLLGVVGAACANAAYCITLVIPAYVAFTLDVRRRESSDPPKANIAEAPRAL